MKGNNVMTGRSSLSMESGTCEDLRQDVIRWHEGTDSIIASTQRYVQCEMSIYHGAINSSGSIVKTMIQEHGSNSAIVITDSNVARLHLHKLKNSLEEVGLELYHLVVAPGEASKSLNTAFKLLDELHKRGTERRTLLVGFGGGALCDLVGFVASIYMRGIPYVLIPTTLIAQIDSAIGGKVGVDHARVKNLFGSFYSPLFVLIDPELLQSLPTEELSSGLAEALKVAIIASKDLFEELECMGPIKDAADVEPELLESVIRQAVRTKLALLENDPFELDLNRPLNFGHSIGHALEAVTDYQVYRHGEAVAVGIAIATRIARQRGDCSWNTYERILRYLMCLELDTMIPVMLVQPVWEHLEHIRRVRNGLLRFVIPKDIGAFDIYDDLSSRSYRDAIADNAFAICSRQSQL